MKKATSPEEQQQNKRIGLIAVGIIILCAIFFGKAGSGSSSSSKNESHTCTWCKKEYSDNGYHHIGTRCEEASNGWEKYDNNCSMKCCEEAWRNGKH